MSTLHIKFDPNQDFQLDAVESVVRIFEGLPKREAEFALGEETVPNLPPHENLSESWLLENVHAAQERNDLPQSLMLDVDDGIVLESAGYESWRYPNFTIEMETGTGKTYVYLRTIYELRKQYGFSKFVIVVPSTAIFEGVIKNFEITRDHFRALYGNEVVNLIRYDGSQLSRLRAYASSPFAEVLVITLDAFNKATNTIYKASERLPGDRKPFQFLQETRPILILDEPQNMESPRSREALRSLHPLFALRYSATHRSSPNLVYRLTPFDAYRRDLVKKIQVLGVTERDNLNEPFLELVEVSASPQISAKVKTYVTEQGRTKEATITLKHGEDLHAKTGHDEHRDGYIVTEIHAGNKTVEFRNGLTLSLRDAIGPSRPEVFRVQIEQTVQQHLEIQEQLADRGIKVLSLFFVDRVASYTHPDGLVRRLFDAAFEKLKGQYPRFRNLRPDQVREAYFAQMRTRDGTDTPIDTSGSTVTEREAEKTAYELIMRKKEQLLSFDEPVCFIFAHSALKEGWDNPNVFQICTLNQTVSPIKKRQEIGRGLRLCVNQEGERVTGDVNVLTVVANESYASYAANLQREYREDGDAPPPPPSDATKTQARRNDAVFLHNEEFKKFWEKLTRRVRYQVNIDTETLVRQCVERLDNQTFPAPLVVVEKGQFVVTQYTFTLKRVEGTKAFLRIEQTNTRGESTDYFRYVEAGDDLGRVLRDERLRGQRVTKVVEAGDESLVTIAGADLAVNQPVEFQTEAGEQVTERATLEPEATYPVFNLVERTARVTGLTRATINRIFASLRVDKKRMLLTNPEGFASVFIAEIRNALAQHVADRVQFTMDDGTDERYRLKDLFQVQKKFPQKELVPAGTAGLYDLVQVDSDQERRFVDVLKEDPRVVFYFKFPPAFKVSFPRIIGNYNPDWGIARRDDDGRIVLHLVRETKGHEDPTRLQFPHESRKIQCAEKHFHVLGVGYRQITAETRAWWKEPAAVPVELGIVER